VIDGEKVNFLHILDLFNINTVLLVLVFIVSLLLGFRL